MKKGLKSKWEERPCVPMVGSLAVGIAKVGAESIAAVPVGTPKGLGRVSLPRGAVTWG